MEYVHADENREAQRLLTAAFEAVPADPATAGDGLLREVRRRCARRRRARAMMSAGGITAAGTATAVLLSVSVAAVPPALAAVAGALSRVRTTSFRMNVVVTQRNTAPGYGPVMAPLHVTGELDLKRNLGEEKLSIGELTLIIGNKAYTKIPPAEARKWSNGKPWTEDLLLETLEPPYGSAAAQVAWDFNSERPFNPQALLALLEAGAQVHDEGSVSGPGWAGTRYRFTISHPADTGGAVDSITCTVDVDRQGHIRRFDQATAFVSGRPGTPGETIYTADFTFSDFGVRFSVTPPPASQINPDLGAGVQY